MLRNATRSPWWGRFIGGVRRRLQELADLGSCAIDAALHRAHGAAGYGGRVLIGETFGTDQDQRLALVGGKLRQRIVEVHELEMPLLLGRHGETGRERAVAIGDLALGLA